MPSGGFLQDLGWAETIDCDTVALTLAPSSLAAGPAATPAETDSSVVGRSAAVDPARPSEALGENVDLGGELGR